MNQIERLLVCLEETPTILEELLTDIPKELLNVGRVAGSWTIHEHACHIATGDRIGFLDRLEQFIAEERPTFVPVSGESFPEDYLINLELEEALAQFRMTRAELVQRCGSLDGPFWDKESDHPEYIVFTPGIMLRHRLFHDHYHMHRIEALWLTRDDYS